MRVAPPNLWWSYEPSFITLGWLGRSDFDTIPGPLANAVVEGDVAETVKFFMEICLTDRIQLVNWCLALTQAAAEKVCRK